MTSITQEKTESILILRQHKKLTLSGFAFSLPGLLMLLSLPDSPGIWVSVVCMSLLIIAILSFYKGVSYTCTTDKNQQTVEFSIKGLFRSQKQTWRFDDIQLLLMGEKDHLLKSRSNCSYEIILDTKDGSRHKLLNFRSRNYCKESISLIENYLEHPELAA